jgi:hypothetical protein
MSDFILELMNRLIDEASPAPVNLILLPGPNQKWDSVMPLIIDPDLTRHTAFTDVMLLTQGSETPCFFRIGQLVMASGKTANLAVFAIKQRNQLRGVAIGDYVVQNAKKAHLWKDIFENPDVVANFFTRIEQMAKDPNPKRYYKYLGRSWIISSAGMSPSA